MEVGVQYKTRSAEDHVKDMLWIAVWVIFAAVVFCLIGLRKYSRYVHHRTERYQQTLRERSRTATNAE